MYLWTVKLSCLVMSPLIDNARGALLAVLPRVGADERRHPHRRCFQLRFWENSN